MNFPVYIKRGRSLIILPAPLLSIFTLNWSDEGASEPEAGAHGKLQRVYLMLLWISRFVLQCQAPSWHCASLQYIASVSLLSCYCNRASLNSNSSSAYLHRCFHIELLKMHNGCISASLPLGLDCQLLLSFHMSLALQMLHPSSSDTGALKIQNPSCASHWRW